MKGNKHSLGVLVGLFAVLIAGGVWLVELSLQFGFQGMDDANIFFRYSRNLLSGHGFRYNVAGEPVEGFTSLGWLACCTAAEVFGRYNAVILLVLAGSFAASALGMVTVSTARTLREFGLPAPTHLVTLSVALLVAAHPSWLVWNVVSLMDAGLYAWSIAFAWLIVDRLRQGRAVLGIRAVTAAAILVLCRPEGVGWVALLAFSVLIVGRACHRPATEVRAVFLGVVAGGAATSALILLWRWRTFGSLLPNTFYAKISLPLHERLESGWAYFASYWRHEWLVLLLVLVLSAAGVALAIPTGAASRTAGASDRPASLLTALLLPWAWLSFGWTLPILAGGDAFSGHRFYQATVLLLVPPAALGMGLLLATWSGARVHAAIGGVALCVATFAGWQWVEFIRNNRNGTPNDLTHHVASVFWIARADREHGERIAAMFQREPVGPGTRSPGSNSERLPTIAYAAAGGISVGYPGVVFDMMGLNDPVLARLCAGKRGPVGHACFDRGRFFELEPDSLLPRAAPKSARVDLRALDRELSREGNWDNTIFRGLFSDAEFRRRYRLVRITRLSSPWAVHGYFRVEFVLRLLSDERFGVWVEGVAPSQSPSVDAVQRLERGLENHRAGRYREALLLWREALVLEPSWPAAHNNVGTALMALDRPRGARPHFVSALEFAPNESLFRNNLAWCDREIVRARRE